VSFWLDTLDFCEENTGIARSSDFCEGGNQ